MAEGFQYFLPGISRAQLVDPVGLLRRGLLAERGLGETLGDVEHALDHAAVVDLLGPGPGGQVGAIVAPLTAAGAAPEQLGYYPQTQQWRATDGGAYWLGWPTSGVPGPAGLARRTLVEGYDVRLGGHVWHVPVVRSVEGHTSLPRTVEYRGSDLVAVIAAEYQQIWEEMLGVFGLLRARVEALDAGRPKMIESFGHYFDLARRVLAINYRYGPAEHNVVGAINSVSWEPVLWAALGGPYYEEQAGPALGAAPQKKSDDDSPAGGSPATSTTCAGAAES